MRDFKLGDIVNGSSISPLFVGIIVNENPLEILPLRAGSGHIADIRFMTLNHDCIIDMQSKGFVYSGVTLSSDIVDSLTGLVPNKAATIDVLEDYDRGLF